uniref:Uncharacterized protein n=1 Tax=Ditylenchus dipsaci TaxID=166011 RepID=A0A915EKV7_9BILA
MERKRNKLLSCIEERWRDSIDELRCFSVLASSMKAATTASWLGGHYCWTLDAGGTALLAQAMSVPGRQVSQKHIKDYLEAGVKNFDWLGELQKVYTFYPSKIVKPLPSPFSKLPQV